LDNRIQAQAAGTYISLIAIITYLVWISQLDSRTHVGAKIHHLWIHHVHKPWADWSNTPVHRNRNDAALEPLNPSSLGTGPAYQKPPPSFKTAVKSPAVL
jgi:hypothetical protein